MTHPNKEKGNSYENGFLTRMQRIGATKIHRNYGSIGTMDVSWTDVLGQKHEAQLKFSSLKLPKVSRTYFDNLIEYAYRMKKKNTKCWLICKCSRLSKSKDRDREVWIPLN